MTFHGPNTQINDRSGGDIRREYLGRSTNKESFFRAL
jgi:hypothetical protein